MEKIKNNQKIEQTQNSGNDWNTEWEYCMDLYKDNAYEALKEFYKQKKITNFIEIYTLELNRDYVYDSFKNEKDINKILEYMIDKQNDIMLAFQDIHLSNMTNVFTERQKELWLQNMPTIKELSVVVDDDGFEEAVDIEREDVDIETDDKITKMQNELDNNIDRNIDRYKKIIDVLEQYYMDCKSGRKAFLKEDMDTLKILLPKNILEQYNLYCSKLKLKEIEEKIKSGK